MRLLGSDATCIDLVGIPPRRSGFSGGFRKRSVNLLEFGENLNQAVHDGIFDVIYSNFILNGGCGLTIPGGGSDLQEVVDLANLAMSKKDAVVRYLAVGAFEKYDDPSFFYLPPTSIEDCFDTLWWNRIAAVEGVTNRPLTSVTGVDLLESILTIRSCCTISCARFGSSGGTRTPSHSSVETLRT